MTDQRKLYHKDIICIRKVKGQKYVEFVMVNGAYKERLALHQIFEDLKSRLLYLPEEVILSISIMWIGSRRLPSIWKTGLRFRQGRDYSGCEDTDHGILEKCRMKEWTRKRKADVCMGFCYKYISSFHGSV